MTSLHIRRIASPERRRSVVVEGRTIVVNSARKNNKFSSGRSHQILSQCVSLCSNQSRGSRGKNQRGGRPRKSVSGELRARREGAPWWLKGGPLFATRRENSRRSQGPTCILVQQSDITIDKERSSWKPPKATTCVIFINQLHIEK